MEFYPNRGSRTLCDSHGRMLEEGSAITADVIAESGARTIRRGSELPYEFSERQRRRAPGILFPVHRPNGDTSWSFRPDRADPERPGHKYEAPCKARGAAGNVLGVLPSQRHLIADTGVPVVFVEGQKKQLSLISATRAAGVELLVVAVSGVWNWLSDGEPIADLADIPLEGRGVTIMYDSDLLRNESVQQGGGRLAEYVQGRGATAYITYFEDAPDGSKVGADDFFAREPGGTLAELRMLTRRYDPEDFVRVRLSRSERLRAMLEDLERQYAAMPAAKIGECSDRATMREAIRRCRQHGKPEARGIVVRLPVRPLAIKTRLGRQGQANSLRRLQAAGYLERIEEPPHKTESHGAAYLLKASTETLGRAESGHYRRERPQHNASQEEGEEGKPHRNADMYTGVHSARASCAAVPELRHSKVIHTWAYRWGRRVVVDSEFVYRLGKTRWEILAYLVDAGGEATEAELLERFGSKSTRPRDFHRRKVAPLMGFRYSRDKRTGQERRLETGPEIVSCDEMGVVRILAEWRGALEEHRKQTGELEDNAHQEQRLRGQSKAYRGRDRTPADEQPNPLLGKERNRRNVAARKREDRQRWVEEQRQKVGMTAATFLADEVDGEYGVRFGDAAERWRNLHGGAVSELWRAAHYGPFVLRRVDGDLFIDPEPSEAGGARPEPPDDPMKHPLACECLDCSARAPSYARAFGGAA
jgi:hypothetical protein